MIKRALISVSDKAGIADFANKLGVTLNTVQKWEAGDTTPIGLSIKVLNKFEKDNNNE